MFPVWGQQQHATSFFIWWQIGNQPRYVSIFWTVTTHQMVQYMTTHWKIHWGNAAGVNISSLENYYSLDHGSLYRTGLYSDTNLTHRNSIRTIIDTNEIFFETNRTYFAMNWIFAKEARNIFYINLRTWSSYIHFMNFLF